MSDHSSETPAPVTEHYRTADVRLLCGDALDALRTLPDGCVQACTTSPPYYGLRDYGTGTWEGGDDPGCPHKGPPMRTKANINRNWDGGNDVKSQEDGEPFRQVCRLCGARRVDRQIGLKATPAEFVAKLVEVFREVKRVLHKTGTCWVNMGDSYSTNGGQPGNGNKGNVAETQRKRSGLGPKQLLGMPWRLAFALQADGWILRQEIIYAKPNPMPESVTDRCTKAHEQLFLLAKSERYFWDAEAVREEGSGESWNSAKSTLAANGVKNVILNQNGQRRTAGADTYHEDVNRTGRNRRSVWVIPSEAYPGAHFATFPTALVEPCVLAGTSARGMCPKCGSPWRRVIEKNRKPTRPGRNTKAHKDRDGGTNGLSGEYSADGRARFRDAAEVGNRDPQRHCTVSVILGWQPGCKCDAGDPIPCLILDPFCGSGTVGAVALKHGRHFVGVDLNPAYLDLAKKRIAERECPLFAGVPDIVPSGRDLFSGVME